MAVTITELAEELVKIVSNNWYVLYYIYTLFPIICTSAMHTK